MDLNTIWFALITVLFVGFFFLEGFDYGVGVLLPFIGKTDEDRRVMINSIGPFWDGNEVWLLTAGGAMFAAFPHWYATLFSGFYLALVLMLLALILRGVAFEFRSKDRSPTWRKTWDWAIFIGSALPALLWGVAVGNLALGVPIDANMNYVGGFVNLLNPYTLVGGLTFVSLFALHGARFLALRTEDEMMERARSAAAKLWLPTVVLAVVFVAATVFVADIYTQRGLLPLTCALLASVALVASGLLGRASRDGWAFATTGLTILFCTISVFAGLFPRVMISSLNPEWSLTIYTASSSPYTLVVMTIVAAVFVPVVLLYQAWTYWVFRRRVSRLRPMEY